MEFRFYERLGGNVELPDKKDGEIIHALTTPELFKQIQKNERLLTYRELLATRIAVFNTLTNVFPEILKIPALIESTPLDKPISREVFEIMTEVRCFIWNNISKFAVWMDRYTTSTSVIRGDDEKIYFWDYQITGDDVTEAVNRGLKDGGFNYNKWLNIIKGESYAYLEYSEYLQAKGGSFISKEWKDHPVFNCACSNSLHQSEYCKALDILSCDSFHKPGYHSGWVQSGFPIGYGRPIALGFGEAAFYPPNNSTNNHAGIVVAG
jgi:hypothetical protein